MNKTDTAEPPLASAPPPLSAAKRRIVEAASRLFAEHGIVGTSLQDIANELGVTKAAVYHQFKTKDEIVLAGISDSLQDIAAAMERAERMANPDDAARELLPAFVALVVEKREFFRTLQGDPELVRLLASNPEIQDLMARRDRILLHGHDTPEARARAAFVASALGAAPAQPLVANLDAETLNRLFTEIATELLGLGQ